MASATLRGSGRAHRPARVRRLVVGLMFTSLAAIGWQGVGALLISMASTTANAWTSADLTTYLPGSVSATRTAPTTCLVAWTPHPAPPAGMTYDVTDGAGGPTTGVATTSTSITVPAAAVTPRVATRASLWTSAGDVAASAPCLGWPGAPVVSLAASTGQLVATWPAPPDNGSPITSYTATTSPASTTCSLPPDTRTCTFTGLTDGPAYVVSVTATSAAGTGPSGTATGSAYPSTIMSAARLRLWLDGADSATLFRSDTCTSAATTGQQLGCWRDKSGQANHAVQPTPGARAIVTTRNGLTAPEFDGTDDIGRLTPSLLPVGSDPSTTIVVAELGDATGDGTVVAWGTDAFLQARWLGKAPTSAAAGFDVRFAGDVTPGSWPVGMPAVVTGQAAAGQTSAAMNGSDLGQPVSAAFSTGTTAAGVGGDLVGSHWAGPIPEVIVFAGTLTSTERRSIDDYLARKWGVALVPGPPSALQVGAPGVDGTTATVSWTAPASDGGSAITSYTATATPTSGPPVTCTATPPATSCALAGLAGNGTRYTVTLTASNATGTTPATTSAIFYAGVPAAASAAMWLAADDLDADGTVEGAAESVLVADEVVTWADKSGNAVDTTTTSTRRPDYVRSLNGLGVVTFDGVDQLSASVAPGITGDRSLFVVVRHRSVASDPVGDQTTGSYLVDRASDTNGVFSLKVCTDQWGLQVRDDAGGPTATCTSSGVTTSPNRVDIVGGFRSGGSNSIWVSGAPGATATLAGTVTQAPVTVGRRGAGSTGGQDLDVAEVLLYDTNLSATDRRAVETYLAGKWGGGLAPHVATGVAGTRGDTSVAVSWTAPTDPGTSAITSYRVTSDPGGFTCTTAGIGCTVAGLTNGTPYTFTVTATNATGTGAASAASAPVTPDVVPGAPTSLAATAGDTTSALTWTAPMANGGTAVTSYTAAAVPADSTLATRTCTVAVTSCSVTGLDNGVTYTLSVTASNAAGTGPPSASTTAAARPAILLAGTTRLWLDAQHAPSLNGSSTCTGADVTAGSAVLCWKDRSASGWNAVRGSTSAVLTGNAINGRQALRFDRTHPDYYDITSAGIGTVGSGDRTLIAVVTARTTTGTTGPLQSGLVAGWTGWNSGILTKAYGATTTVTDLQADGYDTTTTNIAAARPSTSPAIASAVFSSAGGTLTTSFAVNGSGLPASSSLAGTWLSYGDAFRLGSAGTVANADFAYPLDGDVGEVLLFDRALSGAERRDVEDYLARRWGMTVTPQAPTGVGLTPGTSSLGVSWIAPAWNGGAAVTDYVIQYRVGGAPSWTTFADGTSTATTATISGLTTATTYEVRVLAGNAVGTGAASTVASATVP